MLYTNHIVNDLNHCELRKKTDAIYKISIYLSGNQKRKV